jgi:hypothetical protein
VYWVPTVRPLRQPRQPASSLRSERSTSWWLP